MPFKITITTTKPADSTALWPFEMNHEMLNQDNTNLHEEWVSLQPGFIDRMSTWITPGYVYEKIYIFDTKENCDEFLRIRSTRHIQITKAEHFNANNFTTTTEVIEI